ncbi:MAG: carbohydrate ABC transporter permease [Pseudomonadales bacterium]|jgi:sorbitol/mannitol transport system permease protein
MATIHSKAAARVMISPSVILLFLWMVVPLGMTIYFSFLRYNLLKPGTSYWGFKNYYYFLTDPSFTEALINTFYLVSGVIIITIVGGVLLGLLLNKEFWGRGIVRLMVIAPFFIMPTVSALVWKNMFMNPVNGLFAYVANLVGVEPIDFLAHYPLASITGIVAWQWLPFATLILLTALQSLDQEQMDAAEMDGANAWNRFWYITVPHLARPITVVILIETIFLMGVFAEILVTTNGGPGAASTNLTYIIYRVARLGFDAGGGAAGGVIAVILANIVALFLMRMIGKNLDK